DLADGKFSHRQLDPTTRSLRDRTPCPLHSCEPSPGAVARTGPHAPRSRQGVPGARRGFDARPAPAPSACRAARAAPCSWLWSYFEYSDTPTSAGGAPTQAVLGQVLGRRHSQPATSGAAATPAIGTD